MNKTIFNIIDSVFSHDKYSVAGRESEFIIWDRNLVDKNRPTFYTHNKMSYIKNNLTNKDNSFGLLFESVSITPESYLNSENYINDFNLVFTHSSKLLSKYSNTRWIPGGGIWIGGSYGKGEIKLHNKNKLCSIVSSNKQMCELHKLRLDIANSLRNNKNIDIFGLDNWVPIHLTIEDYMFSIVVENYEDDLYFTEKILNCFATGTIPIYLGAKKISDKFDIEGILQFKNIKELNDILPNLSEDLYKSKLPSVIKNYNLCKEYTSIEDYIYLNYFQIKN